MSLCCTVVYKWVTVMDGIQFEFNDIISLYMKNDSEEDGQSAYDIKLSIFDDIIVNKVIYLPI